MEVDVVPLINCASPAVYTANEALGSERDGLEGLLDILLLPFAAIGTQEVDISNPTDEPGGTR